MYSSWAIRFETLYAIVAVFPETPQARKLARFENNATSQGRFGSAKKPMPLAMNEEGDHFYGRGRMQISLYLLEERYTCGIFASVIFTALLGPIEVLMLLVGAANWGSDVDERWDRLTTLR